MPQQPRLVILGGTSLVASYLVARLGPGNPPVQVAARRRIDLPDGFRFVDIDALQSPDWTVPAGTTLVSLLPLPVLVTMLARYEGAKAIVALGSTSRFSKARSADPADRAAAAALESAEWAFAAWCRGHGTRFTLLRPTLVYDLRNDRNIARMARFIRRFRLLPLAWPANGLRQPIHADDVAKAILAAVANAEAFDKIFTIAGAERLTYRTMAERLFSKLGIRPRFLMLPTRWLRAMFATGQKIGLLRESTFGSSVFQRMNEDLVYDVAEGLQALRYDPRPFDLPPEPRPGDLDHRAVGSGSTAQT